MLKPETERMRTLLVDAITTLCRSGLQYSSELKVEGLLGITLDASDIILVSVNQKFDKPGIHVSVTSAEQVDSSAEELELEVPSEQSQSPDKSTPVKRPHSATKSNHSNSKAKRRKALQRDEEGSLSSEKQSASESQVEPPFTVISGLDNSNDSVNETNATQDKTSGSDNSSTVKPSSNMQPSTSLNQPMFPTIKIEIEDDSNDGKVKMEPDELLLQSASSDQQNTSGSGPMPVLLSQNITQTGMNPGFSETDASMLQFGNMSNLLGLSQPSTSSTNSSPRFPGSKTKPVKLEKRKRQELTAAQKRLVCEYKKEHPSVSGAAIIRHFDNEWGIVMGRSTVSEILKCKETWLSAPLDSMEVRARSPRYGKLEKNLSAWIIKVEKQGVEINNHIILAKAREYGIQLKLDDDFRYSNSWLQRFKKRHALMKKGIESSNSVTSDTVNKDLPTESAKESPSSLAVKKDQEETPEKLSQLP